MATENNFRIFHSSEVKVREYYKRTTALFGLISWNTVIKVEELGRTVYVHIPNLTGKDSVFINGEKVLLKTPTVDTVEQVTLKKEKKKKLVKCIQNGKVSMEEADAKKRANKLGLRAYKCEFCPHWHLTHKKDKLKMH